MWGKFSNGQRWCLSKSNFYLNKTVFEKCSASDSAGLISFDFSPAIYFDASHTPFSTCVVMAAQFQTIVLHARTKPLQYVNMCSCLAWSTLKVRMYSCECMKKTSERKLTRAFAVQLQLCSSYPGGLFPFMANLRNSLCSCEDRGTSHSLQLPSSSSHPGHPRPASLACLPSGNVLSSPLLHLPPLSLQWKVACEEWEFVCVLSVRRHVLPGPRGVLEGSAVLPSFPQETQPPKTPVPSAAASSGWGLLGHLQQSGPQPVRTKQISDLAGDFSISCEYLYLSLSGNSNNKKILILL